MSLVFAQAEITDTVGGTGLSSRKPVRVATTVNGVLATAFADGQTIDGVVIAVGNRILIKNQASQLQNGVYIVPASGAPVRATDYDDGDAVAGSFVYVQEGTTNGSTGWLCTNISGADIIGVNNITFKLISGDVSGGGTSTDNAIVRWDGVTGTKTQNSAIIIDDGNNMTGLQYLQFSDIAAPSNPAAGQGRLYKKTGNDGIWWRPDAAGPEVDLTVGMVSWSGGTTGLTPATASTGAVTIAGTLVVSNGGTGRTTLTANGLVFGNGTAAVGSTAAGTTGQVLVGTTGSAPSWSALSGLAVTSLTGTANQVAVSASTGTVTVSTPSTFIAPGTIQDTTGMAYSTNSAVSAAGTNQATATQLAVSYNVVTTAAAGTGVILPAPGTIGYIVNIVNRGANPVNIYPSGTDQIDGLAASLPVVLPVNATATYQASSLTQWYTVNSPITAGAGTAVTYGNGFTNVVGTGLVNVQDEGTVIAGGPHTTLNFVGGRITATNAGGGVANMTVAMPVTTKGDLFTFSTNDDRLPVGANNYLLTADSSQSVGLRWTQAITPAQLPFAVVTDTIAADQNNYNPAGLSTAVQLRLTATGAARSITGLVISGSAGAPNLSELKITNVGALNIILRSESASSTAGNRFLFDSKDIVLLPGQNCTVWYDWTSARWRGVATSSDGKIGGQHATAGVISPPVLSASQNNYSPTGLENASVMRLFTNAIVDITGLAGGYEGRRIVIINIGNLPITIVGQSPSSLAANRFFTGSSDTTIVGNNSASLIYDGTSGFWRVYAGTGGAVTGAGGLIQSKWLEVTADRVTTSVNWTTYASTVNLAGVLPTGTITVVTTGAAAATPTVPGSPAANAATPTNPQTLIIQSTTNGAQLVTYTGLTGTTFTGCTGGVGAIAVGNYVWNGPLQTSIGLASNGVSLPAGTINVVSTTGYPASGILLVSTTIGTQRVTYTGVTATTFTGCVGGGGTMSTGGMIYNVSAVSPHDLLTMNITTSGGALIIISTANASTDSNRTGYFHVLVDGFFRRGGSTQGNGGAPSGSSVVSLKLSNVPPGDHVVTVRWVIEGGTLAIRPVTRSQDNNASLLVQEVSN